MTQIHRHGSPAELAEAAALFLQDRLLEAVKARGSFSIALAGGSTPRSTYQYWARLIESSDVAPSNLHIFWGDERCVPADDPMSNYQMAFKTLLSKVVIPQEQIHPIHCHEDPIEAAGAYERQLNEHFGGDRARFDVVLLGLGEDAHTASLFPGSQLVAEETHWVGSEFVEKLAGWRATLTPPAINAARRVLFLVQGQEKASAVRQVIKGEHNPHKWPAQIVNPTDGRLHWFLDEAAGKML